MSVDASLYSKCFFLFQTSSIAMAVLSKEPLKTKRSKCSCGGDIRHFKNRFSTVTVYTGDGPVQCKHLEYRCARCMKGYYFGYSSDVSSVNQAEESKKTFKKIYEEDCLEQEVILFCQIVPLGLGQTTHHHHHRLFKGN